MFLVFVLKPARIFSAVAHAASCAESGAAQIFFGHGTEILRCSIGEFEANYRGRRRRGGFFRGHCGGGSRRGGDAAGKIPRFLDKVRISGGGRCNVTHACFEPREFSTRYPRGGRRLLSPFHKFSARDTVAWFEARGVKLKTENDGRMFPVTDSSQTIVDCLMNAAQQAGVKLRLNCTVESTAKNADKKFELTMSGGGKIFGATDCCWPPAVAARRRRGNWRFRWATRWNRRCRRCSRFKSNRLGCARWQACRWKAEVSVPAAKLRERGPLLVTHWGLSGPAILKMSAWGARVLHDLIISSRCW